MYKLCNETPNSLEDIELKGYHVGPVKGVGIPILDRLECNTVTDNM